MHAQSYMPSLSIKRWEHWRVGRVPSLLRPVGACPIALLVSCMLRPAAAVDPQVSLILMDGMLLRLLLILSNLYWVGRALPPPHPSQVSQNVACIDDDTWTNEKWPNAGAAAVQMEAIRSYLQFAPVDRIPGPIHFQPSFVGPKELPVVNTPYKLVQGR